jgi:hypothetical protein
MTDPTKEQMERAVAALWPFVEAWDLPLNPEDLHELAGAVLEHANSDATFDEIDSAVRHQLAEYKAKMENLYRD